MDRADLVIRPLEPRDLPVVAAIHRAAFVGYRTTLLGPRFVQRMYAWFLAHPEGFGWVVERSDCVRGFVVGSGVEEGAALLRFTAAEIARALLSRPWILLHPLISTAIHARLRAQAGQLFHHLTLLRPGGPPALAHPSAHTRQEGDLPTVYLWGIGVRPDEQGTGLGTTLMAAFERDAIRRGYRRGQLMVRAENEAASRCYRRCGWNEVGPRRPGESLTFVKPFQVGTPAAL